jgi:hypothetical protein
MGQRNQGARVEYSKRIVDPDPIAVYHMERLRPIMEGGKEQKQASKIGRSEV